MSEANDKKVEAKTPEKTEDIKSTEFVVQEGKGKKALKWVLRGLAVLATAALGFFAGRASVGDSDEEAETTEEKTEE